MNRRFLSIIMTVAFISCSLYTPVYADDIITGDAIIEDKNTEEESLLWESLNEDIESSVFPEGFEGFVDEEPLDEHEDFWEDDIQADGYADLDDYVNLDITGTYYTLPAETILEQVNRIRKEAYDEGLVDEYVPLKWSSMLENSTRMRAMESGITMYHANLFDGSIYEYVYEAGNPFWALGENLAWNNYGSGEGFTFAIKQFYDEKKNYLAYLKDGKQHGETGHYLSLIDPGYEYVGMAGCKLKCTPNGWTTFAMQLGGFYRDNVDKVIDETKDNTTGTVTKHVWTLPKYISNPAIIGPDVLEENGSADYDIKGKIVYPTPQFGNTSMDFFIPHGEERYAGWEDISNFWSSSNESIAKVKWGRVTAVDRGKATITADLSGKKATKDITVGIVAPVKKVTIEEKEIRLYTSNAEAVVNAKLDPLNTSDKEVIFRSSDTDVFTLTGGGLKNAGEVKVTAVNGIASVSLNRVSASNFNAKLSVIAGDGRVKTEISVVIVKPTESITPMIDDTALQDMQGYPGKVFKVSCTALPDDAYDNSVEWTSDDESVARVEMTGETTAEITCTGAGHTTITCICKNAPVPLVKKYGLDVVLKASRLELDRSSIVMYVDDFYDLKASVLPEGLAAAVNYLSEDPEIANVDQNGRITANKEGTAKIIVSSDDAVSAECMITVRKSEVVTGDVPYDGDDTKGVWLAKNSFLSSVGYTGKNIVQPDMRIYHDRKLLKEKTDYTLTYSNNLNAAEGVKGGKTSPSVTVNLKGLYSGSRTYYFTIEPVNINNGSNVIENGQLVVIGNGKDQKPTPELYYADKKLNQGKDFTCTYPDNEYSSTDKDHKITVTGIGNFTGTRTCTFRISDKKHNLARANVTIASADPSDKKIYYKTGLKASDLSVTVKINNQFLDPSYYTITSLPKAVGKGNVTIAVTDAGRENSYYGYKVVPITSFADRSMKDVTISGIPQSVTYRQSIASNGGMKVSAVLKYESETLAEGRDYTVTYASNTKAGNARVTYEGIGRYTGKKVVSFAITPYTGSITVIKSDSLPYVKGGVTPDVKLKDPDGYILKAGSDYTVSIRNRSNLKVGLMIYDVSGKGNYKGFTAKDLTTRISGGDIARCSMILTDKQYSAKGNGWKSPVKITDVNGSVLTAGKDYDKNIIYSYRGINSGTLPAAGTIVYVTAIGRNEYAGSTVTGSYRIYAAPISSLTFVVDDMVYTGSDLDPVKAGKIHVYASAKDAKAGQREITNKVYEAVSYTGNINPGTGKVIVRGLGDYGGTKTLTFRIIKRSY